MKEFLVIKCLNCGLYLVENDNEGQIDCPFCGYSNELTDIRIEWWKTEDRDDFCKLLSLVVDRMNSGPSYWGDAFSSRERKKILRYLGRDS